VVEPPTRPGRVPASSLSFWHGPRQGGSRGGGQGAQQGQAELIPADSLIRRGASLLLTLAELLPNRAIEPLLVRAELSGYESSCNVLWIGVMSAS
jgi:hypothetical protein